MNGPRGKALSLVWGLDGGRRISIYEMLNSSCKGRIRSNILYTQREELASNHHCNNWSSESVE